MERSERHPPGISALSMQAASVAAASAMLAGCAHIEFESSSGMLYYEPVPHLLVTQGADCSMSAALVMLPGEKRRLRFVEGYGAADLKVSVKDGMITEVGQNVDNRLPEILSSLAELKAAAVAAAANSTDARCAGATLYPIVDGKPAMDKGMPLGPKR